MTAARPDGTNGPVKAPGEGVTNLSETTRDVSLNHLGAVPTHLGTMPQRCGQVEAGRSRNLPHLEVAAL